MAASAFGSQAARHKRRTHWQTPFITKHLTGLTHSHKNESNSFFTQTHFPQEKPHSISP
ncbi:protein of unknown function [Pararobbsia alpina]